VKSRLSRLTSYGVLALALIAMGGVYTAVAAPSSARPTADEQQSLAVKEGRALYLTGCSTCHGVDLQGGDGGPSLVGVGAASVVFQVESGRMPLVAGQVQAPRKEAKYTIEQIDQLAAFIQANGGGPDVPEQLQLGEDAEDGQLALGGDLFRTNCASCHNSAGSGGALSFGKYAPALAPASARVIYTAMQSGPESMPRFGDNQLTPEEKQAITSYVRYVTQAANPGGNDLGKFGPVPEGLVAWLVGIGLLVTVTLWIGARA
jgi:ubiquinol-cytochrome c reductase cytochrome c subunit